MLVEDYIKSLKRYEFVDSFMDYDSGYLCDIISTLSDNDISVYSKDLIDFYFENQDYVEDALFDCPIELPKSGISHVHEMNSMIEQAAVWGWYYKASSTINKNLKECALAAIVNALVKEYGIVELSDEQIEELEWLDIDSNSMLDDLIEESAILLGLVDDDDEEDED